MGKIEFENVLVQAARLPYVNVDRELFLRKELRGKYDKDVVDRAIEYNPAYAGIDVEAINQIAKSCIVAETAKVTTISAVTGIPGGFAMIGTIPADLAQYFGHILRILQELIYLYGWPELKFDKDELDEETKNQFTLFVGVMFGVRGATTAINKIAAVVAKQVAKKLPQKALTKGIIYPIVKKIAAYLGVNMTKQIFAKGVSKAVPLVGAAVSGGLTFVTFKPMAERLRKYLETNPLASVQHYKEKKYENVVDVDFEE